MAYSGVAQTGFMIAPLAVAGNSVATGDQALSATVTYLMIYAAMNLGAFAVIITLARRTGSAEISSYSGAFHYAPGLTLAMTVFLFSLAGIPPLGGWFAKFEVFRVLATAGEPWGYALAVVAAVNSESLSSTTQRSLAGCGPTKPQMVTSHPCRSPLPWSQRWHYAE